MRVPYARPTKPDVGDDEVDAVSILITLTTYGANPPSRDDDAIDDLDDL